MGQRITIEINKKIATCLTELPIVCGNSDYECEFVFDEEWNGHLIKTARFRVNGEYTDVVFEGNVCNMPIISDAKIVWVGVFAGELSTSTPAIVRCKPSILDGEDVPGKAEGCQSTLHQHSRQSQAHSITQHCQTSSEE